MQAPPLLVLGINDMGRAAGLSVGYVVIRVAPAS
jgi:hypothetical protein